MKAIFFLAFAVPICAAAQVVVPDLPVTQHGLGAYSVRFSDVFSPAVNPASLADLHSGLGLITSRKFGMRELSSVRFSGAFAVPGGGLGLRVQFAGHPALYQLNTAVAYGKSLRTIALGMELGYLWLQAPGYGNDGTVHTALGARVPLSDRVFAGLRLANFLGGRFRYRSAERLGRVVEGGLGYEVSDQVFLSLSLVKAETSALLFLFYMEYRWLEKGFFTLGLDTQHFMPWLGLGWQFGRWRTGLQTAYHPVLGLSPALQLIHSLKKSAP